jgi:hypothetical protein
MTGYQKLIHKDHKSLYGLIEKSMLDDHQIHFYEQRLTGASEVFKKNQQVSMVYKEKVFQTVFDGRREVILSENYKPNNVELLDTKPFNTIYECQLHRILLQSIKTAKYNSKDSSSILPVCSNILSLLQRKLMRLFDLLIKTELNLDQNLWLDCLINLLSKINRIDEKHNDKINDIRLKILKTTKNSEINKLEDKVKSLELTNNKNKLKKRNK